MGLALTLPTLLWPTLVTAAIALAALALLTGSLGLPAALGLAAALPLLSPGTLAITRSTPTGSASAPGAWFVVEPQRQ